MAIAELLLTSGQEKTSAMHGRQQGFTLTELLIAMAIVGVMAAVAIPTYQNFVLRTQVSEALQLASTLRIGVAEYQANTGAWPQSIKSLGLGQNKVGNRVIDLRIEDGTIIATFGGTVAPRLNGKTLAMRPGLLVKEDSEHVIWQCGNEQLVEKNTKVDFAGTAEVATSIEDQLLPAECRAP